MSIEDIRMARGIACKIGDRVRYTGGRLTGHGIRYGTIVGTHNGYLRIRLDGDKQPASYHPTWELEFLGKKGVAS